MNVPFKTATVVTCISVLINMPAIAASINDDVIELQKEVQALKEGQDSMKKDLAEIRKLLDFGAGAAEMPRKPTTPRKPPQLNSFGPHDVVITGASVMGDANARVTLVEYNDYQCTYCARHSRQTMPELIEHYIKTGKVKFVIREFPIPNLQPRSTAA